MGRGKYQNSAQYIASEDREELRSGVRTQLEKLGGGWRQLTYFRQRRSVEIKKGWAMQMEMATAANG